MMDAGLTPDPYDGTAPFSASYLPLPDSAQRAIQLTVMALIVVGPFAGLVTALWLLWGYGVGFVGLGLAAFFYLLTGFAVTAGFRRCFTHRSYKARPALRVALAVAGSLSVQGDVTGWVAAHRRHHAFPDRPGDPHSPYRYGTGPAGQLRGVPHAHVGSLLGHDPQSRQAYAPDLLADPAMRATSRAFPALCVVSLAAPFGIGWAIGGLRGALLALLWAGLVRISLLQHVAWSVNSLRHVPGSRPFNTRQHDRATNLWRLAVPPLGESWHNMHHSDPTSARHGVDRRQLDPSAELIRVFERSGWVTDVRWPTAARLEQHRRRPVGAAGGAVASLVAAPALAAARTEDR